MERNITKIVEGGNIVFTSIYYFTRYVLFLHFEGNTILIKLHSFPYCCLKCHFYNDIIHKNYITEEENFVANIHKSVAAKVREMTVVSKLLNHAYQKFKPREMTIVCEKYQYLSNFRYSETLEMLED